MYARHSQNQFMNTAQITVTLIEVYSRTRDTTPHFAIHIANNRYATSTQCNITSPSRQHDVHLSEVDTHRCAHLPMYCTPQAQVAPHTMPAEEHTNNVCSYQAILTLELSSCQGSTECYRKVCFG
jgi:hypothetical protein